jgi:hypothetical protein
MIFFGDSHVLCFERKHLVFHFNSASARGLIKENSSTGAGSKIKYLLNKLYRKDEKVFFMFGEVDMSWIYPYKKYSNNNYSVLDHIKNTIDLYMEYLNYISIYTSIHPNNICVLGAHIPTLSSDKMLLHLNNQKTSNFNIEYLESQENRTYNIILFNNILKKESSNNKFNYFDITELILDKETNIINNLFLNKENPYDNHLSRVAAGDVWEKLINTLYYK